MNKALYIGAGTDLKTIKNLPHIKSFIYIDSQPHNEMKMKYKNIRIKTLILYFLGFTLK